VTDARKWLPGSLGSFVRRERSGAFGLAARARVKGRGKAAGQKAQWSGGGRKLTRERHRESGV